MNLPAPNQRLFLLTLLALVLGTAVGCGKETAAEGVVREQGTNHVVAGAHVIELAIHKNTQEFVAEGFTDSTGTFSIDGGKGGFGLKSTRLILLVNKEGFRPTTVPVHEGEIVVALHPY